MSFNPSFLISPIATPPPLYIYSYVRMFICSFSTLILLKWIPVVLLSNRVKTDLSFSFRQPERKKREHPARKEKTILNFVLNIINNFSELNAPVYCKKKNRVKTPFF